MRGGENHLFFYKAVKRTPCLHGRTHLTAVTHLAFLTRRRMIYWRHKNFYIKTQCPICIKLVTGKKNRVKFARKRSSEHKIMHI